MMVKTVSTLGLSCLGHGFQFIPAMSMSRLKNFTVSTINGCNFSNQLTDLLDQYAMTPLGLHCLLQIYLARAEGAK